jgi:hypothetical protein
MRCCTLAFLMGCVTQCSRDLSCPYRLLPGRAAGKAAVSDAASAAGKAKKGLAGMPSKSASGKAVSFTRISASALCYTARHANPDTYKPTDLNRDWSPRFSTLWDKTAASEPKRPEI